jgi:drug/metabolite transporter (DMT)-like permease
MDLTLTPAQHAARRQGVVALLVVQLLFGLFPVFGKYAFVDFSPRSVTAWRIAVGALSLGAIALLVHGRAALVRREDLGRLLLCALFGVVFNMALFLEGLRRSTAISTALLLPLIPVFTAVVAIVLRQERFDRVRAGGMLLAFAGASILLFGRGAGLDPAHLSGNLLVVANEVFYAIYLVIARPLLARYPPLVVVAWVFGLSAWAAPLLVLGEDPLPSGASMQSWWSLLYIVVGPTVLTYMLNVYALARVSASTTASFIFIQPAITVLASQMWLREPLPENMVLSTVLTFAGVWIVARRPAAKPLVAEPLAPADAPQESPRPAR